MNSKPFFYIFVLVFCSLSANASWQMYQNGLRNTGAVNGTGYFPLATANFSNEIYGMDFQPLAEDLNNDGYNEIIIFSGGFLKIFDYELELLDERFTGTVLGQPTIFNKDIIFNSKLNGENYFFVYRYNDSGIHQKSNITLSNDADFSGIKCLNLNGADSCVFKDKRNYVHIIDTAAKADNSYNTSAYNETRQTSPAVGDIDNDGNLEAVFWLNRDGSGGYGLLVFDLVQGNVKWAVDDIFFPIFGNPLSSTLKGSPVLVDLNNDGKLEIAASVFYHDDCRGDSCDDYYTEIFVYNSSGGKLFSKCEQSSRGDCYDGSSGTGGSRWEGTNPFVMDANNDGVEEICFIKDKKAGYGFKNMTINCYNYSGGVILDSEISVPTDTVKTAVIADMNNDGNKEIVTENRIYALNGTSIFSYGLGSNFVIPVDMDGNNRLDLVWTRNGITKLFLDNTGAVKVSDVLISPENPSIGDSLSCSWKVNGNNKIISANASWYRNNEFFNNEIAACINNTLCRTAANIRSSALSENDVWKCSVAALENNKKSLPKSDTSLILGRSSEWADFGKNIFSYGTAPGNGYFTKSGISAISYNSSGADFQPMAADVDNNGQNEIVAFSNTSLIILDKNLNIIAQKQVGSLRGQFDIANMDNDAYLEIIAVLNSSSQDNFTILEFNGSDFKVEASFDVTSQNGYQDIKCIDFDKDNASECIFRDYNGIVHSYQANAASQNDDELNVNISDKDDNVFGSKVNIVPSFADFDRDNDLDALLWFNDNFAVVDSMKNIVLYADVGTLHAIFLNEPTLLGLKFVNLDRAADYEIAVAYRHDYSNSVSFQTDINLSLLNSKGNVIFSKIFGFFNVNPCLNSNVHCLGYGSDLIIYDYDKDGFDDIGIYLEGAENSPYGKFIKFFDRNGREIASNRVEFHEGSSTPQSATLADIDNDNDLELILRRRIYNLDGTVLYNFSDAGKKAPIAVDVDKNKGLDLLWFSSSRLNLLLDNSSYKADLAVEKKDISFLPLSGTSVIVAATVHNNGGLNLDGVKVKLTNTETLESSSGVISIKGNSINNFTAALNLRKHDKVMAQANYDNSIEESSYENNFASREFEGLKYVYVSADLEPFNVNSEFQNYIKNKLTSGYYTSNENEADAKVYIGKNNPVNQDNNVFNKDKFSFGYDYGEIIYYDKTGTSPYSALVGAFKDSNGKTIVMIAGNEIEGDIIGTKEFIKNQVLFLNIEDKNSIFVDDENADAVKAYDYLHLGGNNEHYKVGNDEFRKIVKNALNDEMFNVFDKEVVAGGIALRLRNLKPNISSDYLEYLSSSGMPVEMPVVLAHGLFSNLTTWEVLGAEISNTGRDTWLIEITGGPGQDCDDCADYTFDDLTDGYVPALLNGVLSFTGKDKLQYVGFSNGCRAALDSLERGKFDSNKVETFVAVGCPGAFEELSLIDSGIILVDDKILTNLKNKNVNHVDIGDILKFGLLNKNVISEHETGKISLGLWKNYLQFMSSTNDFQPGKINITKFAIIQGNALGSSDGIVTIIDENSIYSNIKLKNSSINIKPSKQNLKVFAVHSNLDSRSISKTLIKKVINNQELNLFERAFNLLNESSKIE